MRECQALVCLVFFERGIGHTHILVDAESHIEDGGNEESATEWAYEHFGRGRELVGVEFGTESHVAERIKLVYYHSVEIEKN